MNEQHEEKHIAVFGDVHGHLRLMFQLCQLWQMEHGVHLDGILQCGDLGFFPNPNNLDKATRRFAEKDPEELGFQRYFSLPEPVEKDERLERTLNGPAEAHSTVRCPVVWCHGNHEDFESLRRTVAGDELVAVDAFRALYWLRSGCTTDLAGVRVGALGGGPEREDAPADDCGSGEPWKWVGERACNNLLGDKLDVLISHSAPRGVGGESDHWGSVRLRQFVELSQPLYHFYGHHSRPIPAAECGRTRCFWLNDVCFRGHRENANKPLEEGCMGLLSWRNGEEHDFEVLDEPWLRGVTSASWRHM